MQMLFALLLTSATLAASPSYKLDMKWELEGKTVETPQVVIQAGKKAQLTFEHEGRKHWVEILANDRIDTYAPAVEMKFKVYRRTANGKRQQVANPHLIAGLGNPATMTSRRTGAKHDDYSITVTASALDAQP